MNDSALLVDRVASAPRRVVSQQIPMQVTPIPRWNSTASNPVDDNAYALITGGLMLLKRYLIWFFA